MSSGGGNLNWTRNLPVSGAMGPWVLVKDTGNGLWTLASQGQGADALINVQADATMATLTPAFVASGELLMRGKIRQLTASGAITAYSAVYTDNSGQITATNTGFRVGFALEAASGSGSVIAVALDPGSVVVVHELSAPGSAQQGVSTEAVIDTYTIPANTLAVGDVFEHKLLGVCSGNSTDTTRVRIRLGGLTGTVVADTTAVASISASTPFTLLASLVVEVLGSGTAGKVDGGSELGYLKAAVAPVSAGQISIDTTIAQTLVVTLLHSTNNTGNSLVLNQSTVKRFKAA